MFKRRGEGREAGEIGGPGPDNQEDNPKKRFGLTSWLKLKFLGRDRESSAVDAQFLEDLTGTETIGRYQVIRKVGQGSMGVVYLGKDPYINRHVGIKVSRPAAGVEGEGADRYRERFFLEAQSAGRLMHPGIVAIYDAGMHKDFCYITMEFIDGPNLERFCKKSGLLPLSSVIEILYSACRALEYAHKQGVVHRDIKPSNIMLNRRGEVRITDFGIARIKSAQTHLKGIVGSPSYMSPEQVREQPIDERSDIFSLGCVLYELLTGGRAFSGENYFSILYKITREEPAPIGRFRNDVPEVLNRIVLKALAKDPHKRYQNCLDLAYDLRVALRGLRGTAKNDKVKDVVDYVNGVPFFEDFSKEQVREILETSDIVKVLKGKVIVEEGEIDDTFFIILSGEVVVRRDGRDLALLTRGDCFGEMSYLSGRSRVATVMAGTDCIMMKISATLMDRSPAGIQVLFLKRFAMALIGRLSRA